MQALHRLTRPHISFKQPLAKRPAYNLSVLEKYPASSMYSGKEERTKNPPPARPNVIELYSASDSRLDHDTGSLSFQGQAGPFNVASAFSNVP